jgi:hypothetical protein
MKTLIALEFATNLFGRIKPDTKKRLEAVIENPCQETWDDAYTIILNGSGRMITLWNAVLLIDPSFCRSKPCETPWPKIPTRETIIEAIKRAVYVEDARRKPLN